MTDRSEKDLATYREHPVNVHARKLLKQAKQPVDDRTLGAPELMLWAVENQKVALPRPGLLDPTETVESLARFSPRQIMLALGETEEEGNTDLTVMLKEQDPARAAGILIGTMMQTLESRT